MGMQTRGMDLKEVSRFQTQSSSADCGLALKAGIDGLLGAIPMTYVYDHLTDVGNCSCWRLRPFRGRVDEAWRQTLSE